MGRAPISKQETAVGIQIHGQKQLTSSSYSSKTTMNSRNPKFSDGGGENPQPQQQKKQVRRRLHTTRPYQERLMNMAEARREIVTALKFHRASMKKAEEQQHKKQYQIPSPPLDTTIQPSRSNFYNDLGPIMMPYSSLSPVSHLPFPAEFSIPSQPPLGLNLNFHDFDNLSMNLYHSYNGNTASSIYSSSSPSSSYSPADEILSSSSSATVPLEQSGHQVIDDEEMRSIGGQHQMQQFGTLNMVNSVKCTVKAKDVGYQAFDEMMEFPSWLDSYDSSLQQHLDDCFSEDFLQDLALPCMDIGEIEGIDNGEWLSS